MNRQDAERAKKNIWNRQDAKDAKKTESMKKLARHKLA